MSLRPLAKILNNAKSTKLAHPTAQCTVYNIQYYTIYRFLKGLDKLSKGEINVCTVFTVFS